MIHFSRLGLTAGFALIITALTTGSTPPAATALHAAQACFIESAWRVDDCAGVLGVLIHRARRAKRAFADQLWGYSALKAATPRARLARGLPDGDFELFDASENAAWAQLRETARATLTGELTSPCPLALHYGAPDLDNDVHNAVTAIMRGDWKLAQCDRRRPTANIFYELTSNASPDRVEKQLARLRLRVSPRLLAAQLASGSYRDRTRSPTRPPVQRD